MDVHGGVILGGVRNIMTLRMYVSSLRHHPAEARQLRPGPATDTNVDVLAGAKALALLVDHCDLGAVPPVLHPLLLGAALPALLAAHPGLLPAQGAFLLELGLRSSRWRRDLKLAQ